MRPRLLRLSEMLTHKEMEKHDFCSSQVFSNDRVLHNIQLLLFIEELDFIGCPNGYSKHTVTRFFHMATVNHTNFLT